MKLDDYISLAGLTRSEFASKIQATPEAVRLWEVGERVPTRGFMLRIFEETRGAVTANDFYGIAPAPQEAGK